MRPGKLDLFFRISYTFSFCVWAGSYSILVSGIYTRQIYGTTVIKSGCVIAWKVMMTVETAGLRGSGR